MRTDPTGMVEEGDTLSGEGQAESTYVDAGSTAMPDLLDPSSLFSFQYGQIDFVAMEEGMAAQDADAAQTNVATGSGLVAATSSPGGVPGITTNGQLQAEVANLAATNSTFNAIYASSGLTSSNVTIDNTLAPGTLGVTYANVGVTGSTVTSIQPFYAC